VELERAEQETALLHEEIRSKNARTAQRITATKKRPQGRAANGGANQRASPMRIWFDLENACNGQTAHKVKLDLLAADAAAGSRGVEIRSCPKMADG
jgi:hypothetical protein